ncbi:hypothetical protein PF005_g10287 [Phytophthora fragariae]|uniref:Photolyase/cryptochrome alpha/beta domain-containing protein n=1 Tax=Phytophthora fragariae TaxID=53985 RepID=A0A6A4DSL2_9STRA|nr:hypothetical protein PF003_g40010 [Phytophthora fragariae]KAE8938809.1 hypothetical protein PF009_g11329 [Phytophthora fragariae]KAE9114287.1 hypothetical protein PF007_g10435 [Phytophthora fragariae]KAE9115716.1 hypothetical protein PF010_g9232 [Phytophthora fragariae]KAE9145618.1 hypothetical protein PF006_g9552 [Phytophthora fragariae]
MSLPDAAEARRISAQLEMLEQQRAQGNLPHEDAPLRLYRVGAGGFVRVLDQHPEPISQGMLDAIDAFIRNRVENDETKAPVEEKRAEETLPTEETEQDAATLTADGEEQSKPVEVDIAATGDNFVVAPSAESDGEDEGVAATQPSSSTEVAIAPPWEAATVAKTPQELLAENVRASGWLGSTLTEKIAEDRTIPLQVQRNDEHPVAEVEQEANTVVDHPSLYEQWPPQLEERRKMWFIPRNSGRRSSGAGIGVDRTVVYWMHSTLRVMQGNYGLEAAILLSRRLTVPLVVVCLVPSSIVYPVCHSTTASDAYARYSFVELYQQFAQAGVPFFGITAKEDGTLTPNEQQSLSLKPNPLYELLDAFAPHAVVTDAMFDSPSRSDMVHLARYLELNRSSCSWSLLSMDSTTCCPAYQLSMKLQSTLEPGAEFASEEQFGAEYASFAQPRNGTYVFSPLPRVDIQDSAQSRRRSDILATVLEKLQLENVNWEVVKAENTQSSSQMRRFSEGEGLQRLSQLLSGSDGQPAIQAELRGGGVLSLMPFIRHGTLFAGYVLRRINEAIASSPTPTTPQERKALAMQKVMRSRAVNHLGKERDYALYLALWSAANGDPSDPNGEVQPDLALLSTSDMLSSLRMSAPRNSSLETYRNVLPGWAYSSAKLGETLNSQAPGAALYDPYELESARTKDLYWNEIQKFLVEQQYLHPLLVVYWAYRVLTWSVSSRAAIATIESLISQCVLGSKSSPDAVFIVWKQLFRLGSNGNSTPGATNGRNAPNLEGLREFQLLLERELASQPKLQLHP